MRLFASLLAASTLFACVGAASQTWPDKPVKMLIPAAAGTSTDIVGRELGQRLSSALGQPVVLENIAGAGGAVGTERAARSPADGYTLVLGTIGTHSINPSIYARLGYDAVKDFVPLVFVGYTPMLVVAAPNFPANSIGELIALARAQPGKLSFASSGSGTGNHLAGELLKTQAGVEMTHVPYKSGAQAVTDVMSGQVSFMFYHIPGVGQQVKAGRLKALGLASIRRSPAAPQAVPVAEQGYPGFDVNPWWILYAPAATPANVVARLRAEAARVIAQPEYQERLAGQGVEVRTMTAEELAGFTQAELNKWAPVVKASGARAD
jgi:tripartite-type tricarboxylate transporter receptor subunit TctC